MIKKRKRLPWKWQRDLLNRIPKDAEIVDQKVLHESVDNGKLKLLISYDVIENIAKELPIIQD